MESNQTMAESSGNKSVLMASTQKASASDDNSKGSDISHIKTNISNLSSVRHVKATMNNSLTTNIHLKSTAKMNTPTIKIAYLPSPSGLKSPPTVVKEN